MSNNTGKRTLVALIAIPFLLAVSYYGGIPFLLFSLLIGLVANYEFVKMGAVKETFSNGIRLDTFTLCSNTKHLCLIQKDP